MNYARGLASGGGLKTVNILCNVTHIFVPNCFFVKHMYVQLLLLVMVLYIGIVVFISLIVM